MAIFLLFLCNFAVAKRLLTDRGATAPDINKREIKQLSLRIMSYRAQRSISIPHDFEILHIRSG